MESKQLIWLIVMTFILGIILPLSYWQGVRDGYHEVKIIQLSQNESRS